MHCICSTFIIDEPGKYYYCSSFMAKLTFKCKFVWLKSWRCNDKVMLFNNKFGLYGSIVELSTQIRHFISVYRRKELLPIILFLPIKTLAHSFIFPLISGTTALCHSTVSKTGLLYSENVNLSQNNWELIYHVGHHVHSQEPF